ncbi:MAG: polynucleotide adenylyltransferase PcnB, partial [Cellvibrionaceae bacterium]|nr:polynucleotide adenylyltransferase PcnB [Cellvibrionaceae bacterium]
HPRFRAAYDFLLLREQSGEDLGGLGDWWTKFQDADENDQQALLKQASSHRKKSRKPRNRAQKPRHQTD